LVARDSSPTTTSRSAHAASYEVRRQDAEPLPEEAGTTLEVLPEVLKWAGLTLLVIAVLVAVYLGASLLGELAVRATYP
jgi:hypothetical protein